MVTWVWVGQRRTQNLEIPTYTVMEILDGGVEALFAKVAKTLKKQSETEGAGSYQSLWKPLWFWFVSSCFGVEVLALQSVTAWCQNWSSGAQGRREAPAAIF